MVATVEEEHRISLETKKTGFFEIVKGTNGWRLIIAAWPKIMQQFVGLTVFNTYSTYFCEPVFSRLNTVSRTPPGVCLIAESQSNWPATSNHSPSRSSSLVFSSSQSSLSAPLPIPLDEDL